MSQEFAPGDFLVFQLESGFALLRVLAIDETGKEKVWHIAAYDDFLQDVDTAVVATATPNDLKTRRAHMALTNRAFESTQVARIANAPLTDQESRLVEQWMNGPDRSLSDRSV